MAGVVEGCFSNYIVDEYSWEDWDCEICGTGHYIMAGYDENDIEDVARFYLDDAQFRKIDLDSMLSYKSETGEPYSYEELCELEDAFKNFFNKDLETIERRKKNVKIMPIEIVK